MKTSVTITNPVSETIVKSFSSKKKALYFIYKFKSNYTISDFVQKNIHIYIG